MNALPRLHAVTDARILALPDLVERAARLAAGGGAALAIHVRDHALPARTLLAHARLLGAVARDAGALLVVNARADVARAAGAAGLQLGKHDLSPAEARAVLGSGWGGGIGVSVHSASEATAAIAADADWLVLGNVFPTASHPGRPGLGLAALRDVSRGRRPVIAIGGITPASATELHRAGAYGLAAISALWDAVDPAAAATAMLAPWREAA